MLSQVFWTFQVSTIWGHLFMFKVSAEKILGGNDWIEKILVAKYPIQLYKFSDNDKRL